MSLADDVVARIDRDELVQLALEVCNIDSPGPTEAPVAEYVYQWLLREGFKARKVGLLADRPNVIGTLPGTGGGYSLLFNSHMDTAVRLGDTWVRADPDADVYHKAWIEDDQLVGEGIVNDKGPMAAFLIAAKAVKAMGVPLKGDLLLTAAVGETSREPSEDVPGALVETQDLGARFLVTHGGVADYALIAEGTGFSMVSIEAGMAWYRISYVSDQPAFYLPYLPERSTMRESPNMIVRAGVALEALERWAAAYEQRYACDTPSGRVIPKAQVGAIRAGDPSGVVITPQICRLYLGAFTVPGQDPLVLKDEIADALHEAGVPPADVELYLFRCGHEAQHVERLRDALLGAHVATFGTPPPPAPSPTCSMWRDVNIWNEVGIPAMTYGPRAATHMYRRAFPIEALYQAACVYARLITDVCNQEKPRARVDGAAPG